MNKKLLDALAPKGIEVSEKRAFTIRSINRKLTEDFLRNFGVYFKH